VTAIILAVWGSKFIKLVLKLCFLVFGFFFFLDFNFSWIIVLVFFKIPGFFAFLGFWFKVFLDNVFSFLRILVSSFLLNIVLVFLGFLDV